LRKLALDSRQEMDSLDFVEVVADTDDRLTHLLFALDAERARGYSTGKLFVDCIETALAKYS
jgi:AraC family transcriptional regulator